MHKQENKEKEADKSVWDASLASQLKERDSMVEELLSAEERIIEE